MAIPPSRTYDLFERACRFPTDREAVVEAIGDVQVASPNGPDTDVATVLGRSDARSYDTVDELHCTLMANLTDDHVGRQRYDDRSSSPRRGEQPSL